MKKVAGRLRIDLAQYRELKVFAQFGTDLDKATRGRLVRGERIVELLKQGQYQPLSVGEQVISLYAGVNGYLDDMEGARVQGFIQEFLVFMGRQYPQVEEGINTEGELTAEAEDVLKKALSEFKEGQFSGPG